MPTFHYINESKNAFASGFDVVPTAGGKLAYQHFALPILLASGSNGPSLGFLERLHSPSCHPESLVTSSAKLAGRNLTICAG
jgi:hypothetical protein